MTVNHEYRAIPGDMTFDEAQYPSPRIIYGSAPSRGKFCRRVLAERGEPGMRYHLARHYAPGSEAGSGWQPLGSTFPEVHSA